VSKKWLIRLKKRLMKKVTLDWDKVGKASGKATFLVCAKHNSMIGRLMLFYFVKGLCREIFTVLRKSGMFISDPNFSIPDPGSKRFGIADPDFFFSSRMRIFFPHPGSGSKKHRIPDPDAQHLIFICTRGTCPHLITSVLIRCTVRVMFRNAEPGISTISSGEMK
jgi:hypothetical protein